MPTSHELDLENRLMDGLDNSSISTYSWSGCTVTVKDRKTGVRRPILEDAAGSVQSGRLLALMGPSGSGKTTLLNVLARRDVAASAELEGRLLVDGHPMSSSDFRTVSSYVMQEDALIGSLTVKETIAFSAKLASPLPQAARAATVDQLISAFGLSGAADTIIGTPIRKGISGGQKRRTSVASQLITGPKILFLDEPTSGLDSTASREVISFIKMIAKRLNLLIIASIHQPSTATFNLFDDLCLLSGGKVTYFGPVESVKQYFQSIGHPLPSDTNPAEYLLDLVSVDFDAGGPLRLEDLQNKWRSSELNQALADSVGGPAVKREVDGYPPSVTTQARHVSPARLLSALAQRAFVKSYRDVVPYHARTAMYTGLAIMMGTVWLRLDPVQESIQPYINSIFFGAAFVSFMGVAYVPAYLEDLAVFKKDRANGLYGPFHFQLVNFLIGLPYLFLITIIFTLITYWLINLRNTGSAVGTYIMWIFLDLLAAESLVVLLSSLVPNFVLALALVAFANGLWMSVGGFLVPLPILNVFYKYVFHYIDYQAYAFQGMMVNQFKKGRYDCGTGCQCSFPTGNLTCAIPGPQILSSYGYSLGKEGQWVGIMISIIVVYRLLCYVVLRFR